MINIDNYNVSRGHTLNLQKMRKNEMHTMQSFWDCVKWKQMKIYAHGTFCCMILFSHEFILGVGQKKIQSVCRIKCLYLCLWLRIAPCFWAISLCFSSFVLWGFGVGRGKLDPFLCLFSVVFLSSPLGFPIYVFSPEPLVASNLTLSLLISHISFQVCLSSLSVSGPLHPWIQRTVRCKWDNGTRFGTCQQNCP